MPERLDLLTDEECRKATDQVRALKKFWTHRHAFLPSYTLGAAAYLDIPQHGLPAYTVRAVRTNGTLLSKLPWLYARLVERLASHLNQPVVITRRFGAPGFHIFEAHERLAELKPRRHFDLQHRRLDFPADDANDKARRLSFTVALDIPAAGAGLLVWDIEHEATIGHSESELEALYGEDEPTLHEYVRGELLVHDGNHLHQIVADRPLENGEQRLTFQGHGVLTGRAWTLYW